MSNKVQVKNARQQHIFNSIRAMVSNAAASQGIPVINDAQALFLSQQLEHMETEVYAMEFPDLKMRQLFAPVSGISPGDTTSSYRATQSYGKAIKINGMAQSLPDVGVSAKKVSSPLEPVGTSFSYTYFDMLAAATAGVPLSDELAVAARRAIEESIDSDILIGDADAGIPGWLSNTDIPTGNVAVGDTSGTTPWAGKVAAGDIDNIVRDIDSVYTETDEDTEGKEMITHLGLPIAQKNLLFTTRIPGTDSNLANYVFKNSIWLKKAEQLVSLPKFKAAGTGSTDIMIGFNPSPEKVKYLLAIDVTFMPVQIDLLNYRTPVIGKGGGIRIYKNKSMRRKEGI